METELQVALINTLDAVRLYVSFLAGQGRRAQVETLAGWVDADLWRGYGDNSHYVSYWYDAAAQRIRERPVSGSLKHLPQLDAQAVFGVWPVRFVEVGQI